jgi:hypothetical protein
VPGQPLDVCLSNINPIIAAAIGRAFVAIIQDAQGAPVSIRARHSLPSTGWSTWNGSLVIVAADCDLDKYIAARRLHRVDLSAVSLTEWPRD